MTHVYGKTRLALHGVQQTKERAREVWPLAWAVDLVQDFRYAVRQVRRSPGFAALAVLCLGLGIGANTSIFSALNSVLLRPFPGTDPEHLVMLSRETVPFFSIPTSRICRRADVFPTHGITRWNPTWKSMGERVRAARS
jgi:hypothetical protein